MTIDEREAKRLRLEEKVLEEPSVSQDTPSTTGVRPGYCQIKPEYLVHEDKSALGLEDENDDRDDGEASAKKRKQKKPRGQNKGRKFAKISDNVQLCTSILNGVTEGSKCPFGNECKFEHDVEKYLKSREADLEGTCPVFEAIGYCPSGIKCRWLTSHFENGHSKVDQEKWSQHKDKDHEINKISKENMIKLSKRTFPLPKSEVYIPYLEAKRDNAAEYIESPLKPEEKNRLDMRGAKILSPLTTVGNLPFRRLAKWFGADVTYCEMAVSQQLVMGSKGEWALARAHSDEMPGFGIQLSANKPWQAIKAVEALQSTVDGVSEYNLNCGCPIDLIYKTGAGSGLLDNPSRMSKILQGMNAVSGPIPITAKIRMGTKDGKPTAKNLVKRLVDQGQVASITLHGRSRQQRYTRDADWEYIKETGEIIKQENEKIEQDKDKRERPNPVWFIGNGDCYSYQDFYNGIEKYNTDSIMIARGALIKPWIFEEINEKKNIDKSSNERLEYIKKYCEFGLQHWGTDPYGINITRRFVCEYLSFTHRYVPIGLLEHLPAKINQRPPLFKGRNQLETLLASNNYKDWIKITEMFLGPTHADFDFIPKHKSNAYEAAG